MRASPDTPPPGFGPSHRRRRLAQRIAEAHRGLDDSTLLAFVSGSVVDGLADERSDIDIGLVWAELPPPEHLQQACAAAGGSTWTDTQADATGQQRLAVFQLDDIEVQVSYLTHEHLRAQIDELLVHHRPDSPLHALADALLKAEPLFGHRPLQALQARLAAFPPELALAMAQHFSAATVPWQAMTQNLHRDALLWCREQQVQACHRLLGLLAAVNGRYHSRHAVKRLHSFAGGLEVSPPGLADRIDQLLCAPPRLAAMALHALEGEVLSLVAQRFPTLDLAALEAERARFQAR